MNSDYFLYVNTHQCNPVKTKFLQIDSETGQGRIKKRTNCHACIFFYYYLGGLCCSVNKRGGRKLSVWLAVVSKGKQRNPGWTQQVTAVTNNLRQRREKEWPQEGRPIPEGSCQQEALVQQALPSTNSRGCFSRSLCTNNPSQTQ